MIGLDKSLIKFIDETADEIMRETGLEIMEVRMSGNTYIKLNNEINPSGQFNALTFRNMKIVIDNCMCEDNEMIFISEPYVKGTENDMDGLLIFGRYKIGETDGK